MSRGGKPVHLPAREQGDASVRAGTWKGGSGALIVSYLKIATHLDEREGHFPTVLNRRLGHDLDAAGHEMLLPSCRCIANTSISARDVFASPGRNGMTFQLFFERKRVQLCLGSLCLRLWAIHPSTQTILSIVLNDRNRRIVVRTRSNDLPTVFRTCSVGSRRISSNLVGSRFGFGRTRTTLVGNRTGRRVCRWEGS